MYYIVKLPHPQFVEYPSFFLSDSSGIFKVDSSGITKRREMAPKKPKSPNDNIKEVKTELINIHTMIDRIQKAFDESDTSKSSALFINNLGMIITQFLCSNLVTPKPKIRLKDYGDDDIVDEVFTQDKRIILGTDSEFAKRFNPLSMKVTYIRNVTMMVHNVIGGSGEIKVSNLKIK